MSKEKEEVLYARATYGEKEKEAVKQVLDNPKNLGGGGRFTEEFEDMVSSEFGKKYGVMVNSGSSALLLAVELLDQESGSEIITPATTFSTTVSSIVQKGFKPVFTDVNMKTYQINTDQVREAVNEDTVSIMVPSLVGNIPKLRELQEIADENDLTLIEDSADTIGAKIGGKKTGKFSDITMTSFYGSHVITAFGGGGMICVDEEEKMKKLKKLRAWGRKSAVDETESIDKRFEFEVEGISYDSKFIFDEIGYNFLPIEASAAFGVEQVKKLEKFSRKRKENFKKLKKTFRNFKDFFILPKQRQEVDTAWLAFPLTVKEEAPFEREEFSKYLEKNNIQTRSLWSGNILRHPGFSDIDSRTVPEELENGDRIMKNSVVIGCHQSITDEKISYIESTVEEFIQNKS